MVIQRWQSVLLLIAVAVMAVFTFCSLGQFQTADYSLNFTTLGLSIEGISTDGAPSGYLLRTWYLFILSIISTVIPAIAIFCFKNLRLQKRLCLCEVLFIVTVSVCAGLVGYTSVPDATPSWSTVIICPLLALCATIMAYNRICSDDRKLRSAYRLR